MLTFKTYRTILKIEIHITIKLLYFVDTQSRTHLETCIDGITQNSVDILGSTSKGEVHLLTLEALWIRELYFVSEYTGHNEKQIQETGN